jgi:outer membrane murein-binding lipoprotein Lpp
MKNFKMILAAVALSIVVAGCSKSKAVGEINKLKDEACACKDLACGEAVSKKMLSTLEELGKGSEPSESDQKAIMKSMGELEGCISKLK